LEFKAKLIEKCLEERGDDSRLIRYFKTQISWEIFKINYSYKKEKEMEVMRRILKRFAVDNQVEDIRNVVEYYREKRQRFEVANDGVVDVDDQDEIEMILHQVLST
jgi:7-cyano-7-deazaguanine synthase in queuosine biosynthesis